MPNRGFVSKGNFFTNFTIEPFIHEIFPANIKCIFSSFKNVLSETTLFKDFNHNIESVESILPDPQGPLSRVVPCLRIKAVNKVVKPF